MTEINKNFNSLRLAGPVVPPLNWGWGGSPLEFQNVLDYRNESK